MMTSSTSAGSTPARSIACLAAWPAELRPVGHVECAAPGLGERRAGGGYDHCVGHGISPGVNSLRIAVLFGESIAKTRPEEVWGKALQPGLRFAPAKVQIERRATAR